MGWFYMTSSLYKRNTKKLPLIEVGPTALAWPTILNLTYDLDLQSPASYGHDLLTCKRSRSTVSRFRRQSGNKRPYGWTDGQTDGRTDRNDYITSLANAVGNKMNEYICSVSVGVAVVMA